MTARFDALPARLASSRLGWAPLASAALACAALACTSPIVGSVCREGLTVCSRECVDLSSDPRHCGACDHACAATETCQAGVCVAPPLDAGISDAEPPDADMGDAGPYDAGPPVDAGPFDGGKPDASLDAGSFDAGPLDAGSFDAGPLDAGPLDAGPLDAGPLDAGSFDAGSFDAGSFDAGPLDAGSFDAGSFDAGPLDAGPLDAGPSDGGGPPGCQIGELLCGATCVQPDRDPMHCGGCDQPCGATEVCVDSACESVCQPPFLLCDGVCVDPRDDHRNCGGCDVVCPSGICAGSSCQGAIAGHLVLVGHDFVQTRNDMDRLAANAVFLGQGDPVRILPYEGDAPAAAIAGVDAAIARFAFGRAFTRQPPALASEVPLRLADADVFVVYAQTGASDATLTTLGQDWASALGAFLRTGGVVVVFDGVAPNMGTHSILRVAGLLAATPGADVTDRQLRVVDPGDALALGVSLVYRARATSVSFTVDPTDAVVSRMSEPVVLHQTIIP